jgi:cytosine/adenosine deaminase-related metal-dependent hydrolase
MSRDPEVTLVEGGRVYDHDGDTDQPPVSDILVIGNRIAAIEPEIGAKIRAGNGHEALGDRRVEQWIDGRDRLVMPGFVSAH